jgi:hypothetical protein
MDGLIRNEMFEERNDATIRSSFLPFIIAQPKLKTSTKSPNVNIHWPIGLNGQSGARFVWVYVFVVIYCGNEALWLSLPCC